MGGTHPEMTDALCGRKKGPWFWNRQSRLRRHGQGDLSFAFLQSSRLFLSLTQTFRGVTNRRKASSLVVSLLTNCKVQSRVRPQTCLAGQAC